ncbi:conserved hypothetical protein [Ricinus communis]|uniref:Uncharacterized protein n=1 Tax=Ricinus communis TaxID=3988 RepID=B9T8I8_RICCO|nr:conserved hypothetical protein [Ricinus communis]
MVIIRHNNHLESTTWSDKDEHWSDKEVNQAVAILPKNRRIVKKFFLKWKKEDHLLRGWIIRTLTEETLGLVIGLDSSQSVWNALKEAYAPDSQEREFTLRQQLTYLKKSNNRVYRPPPLGKKQMNIREREMYKNEYYQLCGKQGHIAKICWSLPKQSGNDELPQALAALTMDTSRLILNGIRQ